MATRMAFLLQATSTQTFAAGSAQDHVCSSSAALRPSLTRLSSRIPVPGRQTRVCTRHRIMASGSQEKNTGAEDGKGGPGDANVQDILTDILRLQTGRAQVDDFVAQKAAMLTDMAKDAGDDLQKIAEGASEEMEAANARILEEVDSQVSELEKELAASRLEQAKREKEFDEFEQQLVNKQNAGLFFKSLYSVKKKPSPTKEEVLAANPGLANANSNAAGSKMRRNVYGMLALLAGLTLTNAIVEQAPIQSILACAAVCVALVFQVVYELSISQSQE